MRRRHIMTGYTAERAYDSLDCDLLVVKPSGFRAPTSRQSQHHVDRPAPFPSWTAYSLPL